MYWLIAGCLLGTGISIIGLTRLAVQHHDELSPRSLSELAAAEDRLLRYFRIILWLCGTLFAFTMYGYIIPRIKLAFPIAIAWSVQYLGEVLLACIPARGKSLRNHTILAQVMALGMLLLSYLFYVASAGLAANLQLGLSIVMTILALLTFIDKPRFIWYELPFIYLSHISIVVAAFSV